MKTVLVNGNKTFQVKQVSIDILIGRSMSRIVLIDVPQFLASCCPAKPFLAGGWERAGSHTRVGDQNID